MYDRLAELPLVVDGYALESASLETSSDFTRVTTTIALTGAGETGLGEDVGYEAEDHHRFQEAFADGGLALRGEYTLDSFSEHLETLELFPEPPERAADRHYRRWGFEAAGLDLALRQDDGAAAVADSGRGAERPESDTDLGSVIGRSYDPVEFVVSTRLESSDRLDEIRAVDPGAEFKLDPTPEWDDDLVSAVTGRGGVWVLDLKGHYEGTTVDNEPDPELYRRVVEAFPDAVVEDPRITDETRPVIDGIRDRVSWDAPVTGVESVEALPFEPQWLNVKPSRFGTLESLLETIEYCEERGIRCYGGGQFELGVGREQIQLLASLFYPDSPNDVAPGGYNAADLPAGLPASPLDPPAEPVGFRR